VQREFQVKYLLEYCLQVIVAEKKTVNRKKKIKRKKGIAHTKDTIILHIHIRHFLLASSLLDLIMLWTL